MLALSLSDKFCCFGIFVFVFNFFVFVINRFLFFCFSFVFVFSIFFVFVSVFVIFSFFTIFVFVNENHTATSLSVRLFVCVSVCPWAYLWNRRSPMPFGSVLLWRLCATLCTSGFMDDVVFGRNGPYGIVWLAWASSRQLRARPGQSLMSMNAYYTLRRFVLDAHCIVVVTEQKYISASFAKPGTRSLPPFNGLESSSIILWLVFPCSLTMFTVLTCIA